MSPLPLRRSIAWALLLVLGCSSAEVGERYRAERDYSRVRREVERMAAAPDLVTRADSIDIAERLEAVGQRSLRRVERTGEPSSAAGKDGTHIGSRACLEAARYRNALGEPERARELTAKVQRAMSWSQDARQAAQVVLIETLDRLGDRTAVLSALWTLAEDFEVASPDGSEIHDPVLNAPLDAVRLSSAGGDSAAARQMTERALRIYERMRERWAGRRPALLADVKRALVLERRARWKEAAAVLEAALAAYGPDVIQRSEASRMSYRVARLHLENGQDLERAVQHLEDARAAGVDEGAWFEATMALASLRRDEGRYEEAITLYRDCLAGLQGETTRTPVVRFNLAQAMGEKGTWDQAVAEFRSLRSTFPRSVQAMEVPFELALHYTKTGDEEVARSVLEEAEADFRRTVAEQGASPAAMQAFRYLFRTLADRREWDEAAAAMIEFGRRFRGRPETGEVLLQAAYIAEHELGDGARADSILHVVQEDYPSTPHAERAADVLRDRRDTRRSGS